MILKNFNTIINQNIFSNLFLGDGFKTTANVPGTYLLGSDVKSITGQRYSEDNRTMSGYNVIFIALGSGTTPPTVDDYKLVSKISDTITKYTSNTLTFLGNTIILTQTVTNSSTNTENIEVNEVGIGLAENTTLTYPCLLITRSVLPETVVIAPGETKTFTVTLDTSKFINNVNVSD